MVVSIDNVAGMTKAAPRPVMARPTMSWPAPLARPPTKVPPAKMARPISSAPLRPNRSPRAPP